MSKEPLDVRKFEEWLIRIPDLAKMWACSGTHILDLINWGELGYCDLSKPGAQRRNLRVPVSEAERYVEARTVAPRAATKSRMRDKPVNRSPFM